MKRFLVCLVPVFILSFLVAGCLNIKTTIKVNKNGSGQITQVFLVSSALSNMMNSSAATKTNEEKASTSEGESSEGDGGDATGEKSGEDSETTPDAESAPDFSSKLMDKDKLAETAKKMGEGVELVSADPYEEGDFKGYKAVYSFTDVSKLKINQNPAELMPSDVTANSGAQAEEKEFITFTFKKGSTPVLTINMPALDKPKEDKIAKKTAEMDESSLNMMKQIYKDMKINMDVEVEGTITDSNAQFKNKAVVTLIDIDFNKILADQKSFNALAKSQVNSLEEMKALVKSVKGLKIELQKKVNVTFK